MITGRKSYVHIKFDEDGSVAAVWGPFPTENEASTWEGIPGASSGSGQVMPLHSPPQWFDAEEGVPVDTDPEEDEIHDNE